MLKQSLYAFRQKILPGRNKLISHLDRDAVLDGKSLGGTPIDDWNQCWLDLQDFLHIFYKRYVSEDHFYLNGIAGLSDAEQLVLALKESTYFRTMLDDKATTMRCADVAFESKYHAA